MGLVQDFRFAWRLLWKSPGTTGVAVLALTLGIGANTTIFSFVNTTLLRAVPFEEPDRLMMLFEVENDEGEDRRRVMPAADFVDFQRENRSFAVLAAARNTGLPVTSLPDPLNPLMQRVSAGYFDVLGVEPARGRFFLPEEDRAGGPKVVVLSHGFWQEAFGGDPGIVGRTVGLGYEPYEIVGVMPAGFRNPFFPVDPVLWLPLALGEAELGRHLDRQRTVFQVPIFGRLRDDVSVAQAQADLSRVAAAMAERHPGTNRGRDALVMPLADRLVEGFRPALLALFAAVGLVLLIACSNVANLLLARALGRRKEIAVRLALGAGRRHLARQLLAESLMLGAAGGGLGLVLAAWSLEPLARLVPSGFQMPDLASLRIDGQVVAFTVLLALATSVVFGLVPLRQAFRGNLETVLSAGAARSTAGPGERAAHQLLVVTEVALSLTLLVMAGLMIRTFQELRSLPSGVDAAHVLTCRTTARGPGYETTADAPRFYERILGSLEALPGVESAGAIESMPMTFPRVPSPIAVGGGPPRQPGRGPQVAIHTVTARYFETLRIPLVRGRALTDRDDAEAPRVAVVNRSMAGRFWPGRDPIGETVVLRGGEGDRVEIVGIVGDVRNFGSESPEAQPELFLPLAQNPQRAMGIAVRTTGAAPHDLAAAVEQAIWKVTRDVPVFQVRTMEEIVRSNDWRARFTVILLGIFAAVALLTAATGIYAVLSFLVSRQTREIGIRIAVGARGVDVVRQVLERAGRLGGAGIALGLVLAAITSRILESQLYGVEPTDPWIYLAIAALLGLVVGLAGSLPAWRATRVDPILALKEE